MRASTWAIKWLDVVIQRWACAAQTSIDKAGYGAPHGHGALYRRHMLLAHGRQRRRVVNRAGTRAQSTCVCRASAHVDANTIMKNTCLGHISTNHEGQIPMARYPDVQEPRSRRQNN